MAWKLITSDDLKSLTKGDFGSSFDYLIDEIIIPAVGEFFASYCKRPDFDLAARTEFFSPCEQQRNLFLSAPPIAATPPVQVWQDTAFPRTYGIATALVNGTDFVVHNEMGIVEKIGHFAHGPLTVKVTATRGYLTADGQGVPADLKLAAIMQTKLIFDRREEIGLQSRSLEGGAVSLLMPMILAKSVTIILDQYRVVEIA